MVKAPDWLFSSLILVVWTMAGGLDALSCYECTGLENWNCNEGNCTTNGFCMISKANTGTGVVWVKKCIDFSGIVPQGQEYHCQVAPGPGGLNLTICHCKTKDFCNEALEKLPEPTTLPPLPPPLPTSTTQDPKTTTLPTPAPIKRASEFIYPWNRSSSNSNGSVGFLTLISTWLAALMLRL